MLPNQFFQQRLKFYNSQITFRKIHKIVNFVSYGWVFGKKSKHIKIQSLYEGWYLKPSLTRKFEAENALLEAFFSFGIFHFSLCLVLFALAWGLIYLDGWDFSLKSDNELCYLTLCQQPTTLRVSLKREETSLLIVVGVLNNILYNNHSRSEDLEIYLGHGIYPPNL